MPMRLMPIRICAKASIAGYCSQLVMLSVGFRAISGFGNSCAFRGRDHAVLRFSSRPLIHLSQQHEKVTDVANIKSQIKRIGTNKKAQERNKAVKSELKTAIRATHKAVASGDKATAATSLTLANKKLDKAVSKGVIHKNQAANRKSAIAKQVAAL
jgi:small subunit ribosomal protein S20